MYITAQKVNRSISTEVQRMTGTMTLINCCTFTGEVVAQISIDENELDNFIKQLEKTRDTHEQLGEINTLENISA